MTGDQRMWRKSSYSGSTGCVEVAPMPSETGIRDSKNAHDGELHTNIRAWRSFVAAVRAGSL